MPQTRREEAPRMPPSQVYLDCMWLIAEAYRAWTHCTPAAWQAYWVSVAWPKTRR